MSLFSFKENIIFSKILDKKIYLSGFLTAGVLVFIVLFSQSPNPQPFKPIEDFVIFGSEKVEISQDSQSLSGDIGSNKEIIINQKSKVVGNLFSQRIKLAENTEIDGNITSQELEQTPTTKILGTISKEITFPVAQIPDIPDFQTGTEDIEITQKDFILSQGNYRDIQVKPNASLILAGNYNLRSLRVEDNGAVLFNNPTTINIQSSFRLGQDTIITPKSSTLSVKEIKINFIGTETIHIGDRAILGFRLITPNTKFEIGEEVLLRGSAWAKEIRIGEKGLISKEDDFEKESDPTKIVEDQGAKFIVNEIIILLKNEATQIDAQQIVDLVNGRIIGFIPTPPILKIEVQTATPQELLDKIQIIKNSNNPLILEIIQNLIGK